MGNSISTQWFGLEGRPTRIKDQRIATLLAMYIPGIDTTSLSSHLYNRLLSSAESSDYCNIQPTAQPPYSTTEQLAVELWKKQVRMRMFTYCAPGASVPKSSDQAALSVRDVGEHAEHRIFRIPELLDLILSFAGPKTQMHALSVASFWQSSALSVIGSQTNSDGFRSLQAAKPIEYGQPITLSLVPRRPTPESIERFSALFHRLAQRGRNGRAKLVYFPAQYTQIRDLPDDIAECLNELDLRQGQQDLNLHSHIRSVSRDTEVVWLDLSQFEINPYLDFLFAKDERIKHRWGRWELDLRASTTRRHLLVEHNRTTDAFIRSIGSMHVTNPAIRCLGLYHNAMSQGGYPGNKKLLLRLRNDEGIRVAELLDAMESVAPTVLETWRSSTQFLLDHRLKNAHWIDNIWFLPGVPRLSLHLDHTDMSDEVIDYDGMTTFHGVDVADAQARRKMGFRHHITRVAYMCAEPFRDEREGEWLPEELFVPMESTTSRSPINWDT